MLVHRLRRWTNINTTFVQHLVFAGMDSEFGTGPIADRFMLSPVIIVSTVSPYFLHNLSPGGHPYVTLD